MTSVPGGRVRGAALLAVSQLFLLSCLDAKSVKYVGCTDAGLCEDATLFCCDGYCMSLFDCVQQKHADAGVPPGGTGGGGGTTGLGGGGVTEAVTGGGGGHDGSGGGGSSTGGGGGTSSATGGGGQSATGGGGQAGTGGGGQMGTGGGTTNTCNASCAGCCDGTTCVDYSHEDHGHCGLGGQACVACDPMLADTCALGTCLCGLLPACSAPQRCMGGLCVLPCDANSCPNGCCKDDICYAQPNDQQCGDQGKMCKTCSGNKHCSKDQHDSNSDYNCR